MVEHFNDENFEEKVLKADLPVLVDFWAEWCPPCRILSPIIEELAKDYEGKVYIGKLNVDEARQTAINYGIMSIPTLIIFKDGNPVDKIIGAVPKSVIAEKLNNLILR